MIKKKLLLVMFLLNAIILLKAQTYYPMPAVPSEWKTERCFYLFSAGRYDEITVFTNGEDTLMNMNTYKKLYKKTHHWPGTAFDTTYTDCIGGMREEDKKVYFLCPLLTSPDTLERLIYDFNPTFIGDTIFASRIGFSADTLTPHLVTEIDSVTVGGNYHRRIFLTNLVANYSQEYWIEGLGSNFGLIYASYNCITDNSYDLVCFSMDGVFQFQNMSPSFGYCTAPLLPSVCDSVTTGFTIQDDADLVVHLFPNPSGGDVSLTFTGKIKLLQIINSYGNIEQQLNDPAENNISLTLDHSGIYFIRLVCNDRTLVKKLIVAK